MAEYYKSYIWCAFQAYESSDQFTSQNIFLDRHDRCIYEGFVHIACHMTQYSSNPAALFLMMI